MVLLKVFYDEDEKPSSSQMKSDLKEQIENIDIVDNVYVQNVIPNVQAPIAEVKVRHDWEYDSKHLAGRVTQELDFVHKTTVMGY